MFLKGFCLLTLSFIISTFQVLNAERDGKLTVVNVYSGLESVDGHDHTLQNFGDDSDDTIDTDDEEDDEDEENEEDAGDEMPENEECCKMAYGNPKVLGGNLRKADEKPVSHGNKKKKKHATTHKKAFYNTKPEAPFAVALHEKTPTAIPVISTKKENMNWNNFKRIVETLKMKH